MPGDTQFNTVLGDNLPFRYNETLSDTGLIDRMAKEALAKDTKVLQDSGYRLEKIAIMEMFGQTKHVETMVLFTR